MAGRYPKATKLHLLEKGVLYGDQKARAERENKEKKDEKIYEKPKCPKDFSKREKELWIQYSHILEEYDIFNLANGPILELLIKNLSDREKCIKKIKIEGIIIESYKGRIYNPFWSAKNRCEENILKYLNALGLSSVGLIRLGRLDSENNSSEMEDLIDD